MIQLHERYRPKRWEDVVGQDKAVRTIQRLRERGGLGGRAFFISGSSGTGKTTIARLIASEIAEPHSIVELDADALTAERLRDIEAELYHYGLGQRIGRAYIVNEAHGLRAPIMRRLLVLLEALPDHVAFIFTTTTDGLALFEDSIDASPLLSRCIPVALTRQGLCRAFAERCKQIAEAESVDGQPLARYERLLKECGNNLRAALQAVDSGIMLAD